MKSNEVIHPSIGFLSLSDLRPTSPSLPSRLISRFPYLVQFESRERDWKAQTEPGGGMLTDTEAVPLVPLSRRDFASLSLKKPSLRLQGKHSMSQERGEVLNALLREGRLASRASRDEAFWRSQVNFGPPNPATDEKALWSKGKRVRCHTPCLPKVPRGRARRSRATTRERIPHRQGDRRRPSRGTSRPTGKTGETWERQPDWESEDP
uniref:Uncharacterized protein n=1 Tax=Vitis vinifera TaxID=29760 RepID=A5AMV9_VITVI|nr:hypothetical protein VITISV_038985 [Vitis vinifera]